jgi:hypothetical protein
MHRSGTSMVARALAACGLELGGESELLGATPDNEHGHWEHEEFVRLADELLARLGGGWDVPPQVEAGWAESAELDDLRDRVRQLVQHFDGQEPWGWKDPRSSLTLPFWRSVLPCLRVVVCVRHPVEIARSLSLRGASSERFGLDLWLAYAVRLLDDTEPAGRVVTHYGAYFENAEAELRRLTDTLGLDAPPERIAAAARTAVADSSRHHRAGEDATLGLSEEVVAAYATLCSEAGPVFDAALGDEPFFPPGPERKDLLRRQISAKATAIGQLRLRGRQEAKRADRLDERVAALERSRAFRYTAPLRRPYVALRKRFGGLE